MSRAFVKEDVEEPERAGRSRSASGLPPGASNYITAQGERRLRELLTHLRREGGHSDSPRIARLEAVLASVTVVAAVEGTPETVTFGATVTVREAGRESTYRIVGVDELEFEKNAVSWVSPIGKALLGTEVGDRVTVDDPGKRILKVLRIEL